MTIGQQARHKAFEILHRMRSNNILADMDHVGRSVKAQFKYADKANISGVCILGEEELLNNQIKVRSMEDGSEELISQDTIINFLKSKKGAVK